MGYLRLAYGPARPDDKFAVAYRSIDPEAYGWFWSGGEQQPAQSYDATTPLMPPGYVPVGRGPQADFWKGATFRDPEPPRNLTVEDLDRARKAINEIVGMSRVALGVPTAHMTAIEAVRQEQKTVDDVRKQARDFAWKRVQVRIEARVAEEMNQQIFLRHPLLEEPKRNQDAVRRGRGVFERELPAGVGAPGHSAERHARRGSRRRSRRLARGLRSLRRRLLLPQVLRGLAHAGREVA